MGKDVHPCPAMGHLSREPPVRHGALRRGQLVGVLPQPGQEALARPPSKGHLSPTKEQKNHPLLHPPGLLGRADRQVFGSPLFSGLAECLRRALLAQRRPVGQADHSSQVHHGLIELAREIQGDNLLQGRRKMALALGGGNIRVIPHHSGGHPQQIAVHRGDRLAKGDGGNGRGGIVSHPGQGTDVPIVCGKYPAKGVHNLPGGFLEISCPAVIAQPLPQLHQLVLRSRRQILYRGKSVHELGKIPQHRRHAGLLQHDLRHPHPIGGGLPPPGQVPGMFPIPLEQGDGKKR